MDRKRKRQSTGNEAVWTAARCQRLLRPISSRIAPLRNLAYITDSYRPGKAALSKSDFVSGTSDSQDSGSSRLSPDPVWLRRSDAQSKCRSYSSKDRSRKQKDGSGGVAKTSKRKEAVPQDGLFSLPTPFRARALRKGTPTKKDAENNISTPCIKATRRPVKRTRKDPFTLAPVAMQSAELHDRQTFEKVFELHQGIVDGFSLLLEKTDLKPNDNVAPISTRGAKSLFSSCLRRVPDYIQAEEDWRKSIDPDDETDVAAEVYEELEDLGSTSKHGWYPLREVVRAHGMKLIHDAIRNKLVSNKTRAELANIALRHDETVETERLIIAFAHTLPLKRPFNSSSPLLEGCLATLSEARLFSDHRNAARTQMRVFDSLYRGGKLHRTWAATKDITAVISRAVRSLASTTISEDVGLVIRFLETVTSCFIKTQPDPSIGVEVRVIGKGQPLHNTNVCTSQTLLESAHKTINSLITVLTAMAIIPTRQNNQDGSHQRDSSQIAATLLQRLTTSIIMECTRQGQGQQRYEESQLVARTKLNILTSALVIAFEEDRSAPGTSSIDANDLIEGICFISDRGDFECASTEHASAFICDLSFCCGQSLNFDAQSILEDLVDNIVDMAKTSTPRGKTFMAQLALKSALGFASRSSSQEAKVFARKIEQSMAQHGSLPRVRLPKKRSRVQEAKEQGGFRWEEGLCEWIAATPLPSSNRRFIDAAPRMSPVRGLCKDRRDGQHRSRKSDGQPSPTESELHDSGYFSTHETPKRSRGKLAAQFLLSSPDVLADEPRYVSVPKQLPELSAILAAEGSTKSPPKKHIKQQDKILHTSQKDDSARGHASAPEQKISLAVRESHGLTEMVDVTRVALHIERPHTSVIPSASTHVAQSPKGSKPSKDHAPLQIDVINTPTRPSVLWSMCGGTSKSDDIDRDELAMSCKKASRPQHISKVGKPTEKATKTRTGKVGSSGGGKESAKGGIRRVVAEESDDELG